MARTLLAALVALFFAGCSSDRALTSDGATSTGDATTKPPDGGPTPDAATSTGKPIPGGGSSGGPVDGKVNVFVIDELTEKAIEGATVMLGDGKSHSGKTNKEGFIAFSGATLKGAVDVTAGMKRYMTSTLVGIDATNVTFALNPRNTLKPPDTARAAGTIADWTTLPPPPTGLRRFAAVSPIRSASIGARTNSVGPAKGTSLHIYAPALNGRTAWVVPVPAGDFGVFALVFDNDSTQPGAPTNTLTHVGVKTGLNVAKGLVLANVSIPVVAVTDTLTVEQPATLPTGTDDFLVTGGLQLAKGNDLIYTLTKKTTTAGKTTFAGKFPPLAGDFAGGSFFVFASARKDKARASVSYEVRRKIASAIAVVKPTLFELPSNLAYNARKLSATVPAGSNFHRALLGPTTTGTGYWEVLFLKPTTSISYTLPTFPANADVEKVPSGALNMLVGAYELASVDVKDFKGSEVGATMKRYAQTLKPVTN